MKRSCLQLKPCDRNCPCDCFVHPKPLQIAAGLTRLPRQIAGFAEFRRAMLAAIVRYPALADWRARGGGDLGLMLLEMWAYVADVQAFYDEVIAHEVYLRSARQRRSLRRLVQLLGYIPRPAVAASVYLAAFAEGRRTIELPPGVAFRSGAFDGEPPQVFELPGPAAIHPFANSWTIAASRPEMVATSTPDHLFLKPGTVRFGKGDPVLVCDTTPFRKKNQVGTVTKVATELAADGDRYTKISFKTPLHLSERTSFANLCLESPTRSAALWTVSSSPAAVDLSGTRSKVTLDGAYKQIRPGDRVLLERNGAYRWFKVTGVSEEMRSTSSSPVLIGDNTFSMPGITVPVTVLELDAHLNAHGRKAPGTANWSDRHRAEIFVHYGLVEAGVVAAPATTVLAPTGPVKVEGRLEAPENEPAMTRFLFEDRNERGQQVRGNFDFDTGTLALDPGTRWAAPLKSPVKVYGNVVRAIRGETVANEILGSGDASLAYQSFKLAKKPLTYIASPTADNERGVANTLQIRVDDILYREVPSFFGLGPDEPAYIVRQDDDDETHVIFSTRLPTGAVVSADYRFGAGAASPPQGAITQITKPAKGLTRVRNPVAAFGGADRESRDDLQTHAPVSALILGRAVSMLDMEAVTAGVAGVRAVMAEWRWNGKRLRAVAQIWYIGEPGIEAIVKRALKNLTERATPIDVIAATAVPVTLSIGIEIDARFLENNVLTDIRATLMNKESGLLVPERIGIGRPLYRSRIFEAVTAVEGVITVKNLTWNGSSFPAFAVAPKPGRYFDLEGGNLMLNGKDADNV